MDDNEDDISYNKRYSNVLENEYANSSRNSFASMDDNDDDITCNKRYSKPLENEHVDSSRNSFASTDESREAVYSKPYSYVLENERCMSSSYRFTHIDDGREDFALNQRYGNALENEQVNSSRNRFTHIDENKGHFAFTNRYSNALENISTKLESKEAISLNKRYGKVLETVLTKNENKVDIGYNKRYNENKSSSHSGFSATGEHTPDSIYSKRYCNPYKPGIASVNSLLKTDETQDSDFISRYGSVCENGKDIASQSRLREARETEQSHASLNNFYDLHPNGQPNFCHNSVGDVENVLNTSGVIPDVNRDDQNRQGNACRNNLHNSFRKCQNSQCDSLVNDCNNRQNNLHHNDNKQQGNACLNHSGENRNEIVKTCQNGAGAESCDAERFADVESGDILDIFQSDITDYSLDLLNPVAHRMAKPQWSFGHSECDRDRGMSQSRTVSSGGGMNYFPLEELITPTCQSRVCMTDSGATQVGTTSSSGGYYSTHGSFQSQPVFPSISRVASGTTFKQEVTAPHNNYKKIVLENGYDPDSLQ